VLPLLTKVSLPDSLDVIGSNAFVGCGGRGVSLKTRRIDQIRTVERARMTTQAFRTILMTKRHQNPSFIDS
jgi:hypothetical protein